MTGPQPCFQARLARACRLLLAAAIVVVASGCAQMVPQTVALRTGWPAGVPQSHQVDGVPFFPQDEYLRGRAALGLVLGNDG